MDYLLDVLSTMQLIWSQNMTITKRSNKSAMNSDKAAIRTVTKSENNAQLSSRQTAHFQPMRIRACVLPSDT